MAIVPPRLDDRTYDDLVYEMFSMIAAHTPEWTDVRVGDPGRTILELFAWLADTILYRANLIPERQRLKFLELLQRPLRSAEPARGLVSFSFAPGEAQRAPLVFRPGARVEGPPAFETIAETTVHPLEAVFLTKRELTTPERERLGRAVDELGILYELMPGQIPEPYATQEIFPGGRPAPLGFDLVRDAIDHSLWIALLGPEGDDPAASRVIADEVRDELRRGNSGRPYLIDIGVVPALAPVERLEDLPRRRKLALDWAVTQTPGPGVPPLVRLEVVEDGSAGLLRDGVVRLLLSARELGAPSNDVAANVAAGVGASPPRIDDPNVAARVVTWIRASAPANTETLLFSWAGINAAFVEQRVTSRSIIVGAGTGRGGLVISLAASSIEASTLRVQVEEEGDGGRVQWVPWIARTDLASSGPLDRHYVLDPEAGRLRFGDGMNGAVPAASRRIRVEQMRAGGGQAGNVPPETLKTVAATVPGGGAAPRLVAWQPLSMRGGEDAETIERAETRIPAELRHHERAVTESDFLDLALRAPGVRVGRAEVLPRFLPHQRRSDVPGVVTVMVLPAVAGFPRAPNPRADRPLIEAVHDWLDRRRTLGTELYVIGVEYVPLALGVGVELMSGVEKEQTLLLVRRSLEAFLWSLPPGGPEGRGWPLGGTVLARELEVIVARVAGIRAVNGVRLFGLGGAPWQMLGAEGLTLLRWQLPELAEVLVVEGAAPTDPSALPEPDTGGRVPVPVVPEVC